MKKLIVLFAILAMVNVASAGIVDIVISSLNGDAITPVKEITIHPSDTIDMDIIYQGAVGMSLFAFSVDAYQDDYQTGGLTVGTVGPGFAPLTWPTGIWDFTVPSEGANWFSGAKYIGDGSVGVWGSAAANGLPGGGLTVGVIAVDHILFHCSAVGTVVIKLREDVDLPPGGNAEIDSEMTGYAISDFGTGVVIHQVPEPMTLTLLGLGSLFLARRKK